MFLIQAYIILTPISAQQDGVAITVYEQEEEQVQLTNCW